MKYVALLRGINVGGNNIIRMIDLKTAFEKAGFTNVITYIQSGNVIFETTEKNTEKIREKLEVMLSHEFSYEARTVVRAFDELKKILARIPLSWKKENDIRCYVAFIREPVVADAVAADIQINSDVDSIDVATGVIYMTTKMSGLTKSKFNKLAVHKNYKDMTIRNYNTTRKLFELMVS